VIVSPIRLPTVAPTTISISAIEMAMQIEMTDASSARPSQSADASQILPLV
jgi:hypothetical protein